MKIKFILCFAVALSAVLIVSKGNAGIIYPKAPDGGEPIVAKYRDADEFKPFNSRFKDSTIARPFGVYIDEGSLKTLLSGQLLAWTRQAAWRYLLMQGTNCVGAIDLNANEKRGGSLKFSDALYPPKSGFENSTLDALRAAEKLPQAQKQEYEFRYLDMEPNNFFAVWLHGKTDDILIPLPPTYGRMDAYQPYSESQITAILGPEAQRDSVMWARFHAEETKNNQAYVQAMTAWEKAHGGNYGTISYYGMSSPFEKVGTNVEIFTLMGKSEKCGELRYKARVTYGSNRTVVRNVEILERMITLKVVSVDSEETNGENGHGTNAVDGDPNTIWHTQWHDRSPGLPHEIVIELVPPSTINGFSYLPRQDPSDHGTIKDFEFYASDDDRNFGPPIKTGTFGPGKEEKIETFEPVKCRFIKLKALSEINGLPFTSAAEIRVIQPGEDAGPKVYWRGDVGPAPAPQDSTRLNGIDSFVAAFQANGGLWLNGTDGLNVPATTPQQVISETFQTAHFQSGMMTHYRILDLRKVRMGGELGTYTMALADTNLGEMIVLMQNSSKPGYWWRRIYSAGAPYNRLF